MGVRRAWWIGPAWMAAGIVAWGGFNTVLEATNTTEFCLSCHVMADTVGIEYRQSPHFSNRSGVRAGCPDCHVPRDWTHKLIRKVRATNELVHWAWGTIDGPEKFEARRHELAQREWERMRATDSRECRNCHSFEAMDFHKQSIRASRAMRDAAKAGKTCIDCHKAVAHRMPDINAEHRRMFTALRTEEPRVGDTVRALASVPLRMGEGGAVLGELAAGIPVRVIALAGEGVEVELEAWSREESPGVLYAAMGKRLAAATLADTAALPVLSTVEDGETGQVWRGHRLRAWTAASGLVRDSSPLKAALDRMYRDNCSLCHALHRPEEYTVNEWIGHFNMMRRLVPLIEPEAAQLLTHLQGRAKDAPAAFR